MDVFVVDSDYRASLLLAPLAVNEFTLFSLFCDSIPWIGLYDACTGHPTIEFTIGQVLLLALFSHLWNEQGSYGFTIFCVALLRCALFFFSLLCCSAKYCALFDLFKYEPSRPCATVTFSSGKTKSGSAVFVQHVTCVFVLRCPFRNSYPPKSLKFKAANAHGMQTEKERIHKTTCSMRTAYTTMKIWKMERFYPIYIGMFTNYKISK